MNMIKVNIMVGRFQPFTKGHYKCVENAFEKKGVSTVIAMIDTPDEKTDEKHPFPSSMLLPIYKDLFEKDDKVLDIILVKNADIVKIGELCKNNGYEIVSWTCGTDRYDVYKNMADKYHDKAGLSDDFEVIEIKRSDEDISATKAREALINDDKVTFNKLTPYVSFKTRLKHDPFNTLREQILKVVGK